jgi:hypothetical protein
MMRTRRGWTHSTHERHEKYRSCVGVCILVGMSEDNGPLERIRRVRNDNIFMCKGGGILFRLGHDRFLPYPFQFIHQPPYHSTPCSLIKSAPYNIPEKESMELVFLCPYMSQSNRKRWLPSGQKTRIPCRQEQWRFFSVAVSRTVHIQLVPEDFNLTGHLQPVDLFLMWLKFFHLYVHTVHTVSWLFMCVYEHVCYVDTII